MLCIFPKSLPSFFLSFLFFFCFKFCLVLVAIIDFIGNYSLHITTTRKIKNILLKIKSRVDNNKHDIIKTKHKKETGGSNHKISTLPPYVTGIMQIQENLIQPRASEKKD